MHPRNTKRLIEIAILILVLVSVAVFFNVVADKANGEIVCIAGKTGGISVKSLCDDKPKIKPKPKHFKVKVKRNGKATIPKLLPKRVKRVIRAANKISHRPYVYGGGHGSFNSHGYDCSGSVSYALRAGGFVKSPMASGPFMSWAKPGKGKYITTYSHHGHMFMEVAGATFDTSGASPSRWQKAIKSKSGYEARHPARF